MSTFVKEKNMPSWVRVGIFITLLVLSVSAFLIRIDHARKTPTLTIDEWIYYGLANQLEENFFDYQTQQITKILVEENPVLPVASYMTQPLFKHPPLFSYLVLLSFKLFNDQVISAVYVACLFGVLMIPLGYLVGRLLFGEAIGLATAFCLWMDPVNIICSQKVWLDSTLSFFIVLSIYFFAYAIKYSRDNCFFLSGISAGLAMLTKYTGVLAIVIMVLYAILQEPRLLRSRKFLWSLTNPFIMLLPWFYWNYVVYGTDFLSAHFQVEHNLRIGIHTILLFGFIFMVGLGFIHALRFRQDSIEAGELEKNEPPSRFRSILIFTYALVFIYAVKDSILRSLEILSFPLTSWQAGLPPRHILFYFSQPIEFSFLYFFSFMSFFIVQEQRLKQGSLLYLTIVVIFLFHLIWGAYQSRYILPAIPFLVITGIVFWKELWLRFAKHDSRFVSWTGQTVMLVLAVYIFLKTNYLNFMVSYPNNMCYF